MLASDFCALASAVLCGGGTRSGAQLQSRQEILRAQASSTSVADALGGSRWPHTRTDTSYSLFAAVISHCLASVLHR